MAIACALPNTDLGIAVRLADFIDCQGRALGENGFQAIAGSPVAAGLLSGLVTIFVALIGYRLILGHVPTLRDGVGWAVRLGIVLTLTTSWPAFQTLIYRVAVDAPGELAAVVLPSSGLPSGGIDERVQAAYDTMRLGSSEVLPTSEGEAGQGAVATTGQGQTPATSQPTTTGRHASIGQPPLPQTASLFVISTEGVAGGLRVAIGFLLAIGPLLSLTLLFDATLGVFSGWIRALAGAALGVLAATIVTAIDLVMIESELAKLQIYGGGGVAEVVDQQALTTITLAFAMVMLIAILAAARVASAFRLPLREALIEPFADRSWSTGHADAPPAIGSSNAALAGSTNVLSESRVSAVTDALTMAVRREQLAPVRLGDAAGGLRRTLALQGTDLTEAAMLVPLGVAGRRSLPRRTRTATARDSSS